MSSLYKRATPSQAILLRIITGAVKNASDAHPEVRVSERMTRSIAKRAVGTLSAQWRDVLAASASMPSRRLSSEVSKGAADPVPQGVAAPEAAALNPKTGPRSSLGSLRLEGGRRLRPGRRRSPLQRLWTELSWRIGEAKRAGNDERAQALIEIIRIVAAEQKRFF